MWPKWRRLSRRSGGNGSGNGLPNMIVPETANVYLLVHADGEDAIPLFYDSSTYDYTIVEAGTATAEIDTSIKKFGTGSAKLGGAATAANLSSTELATALAAITTEDMAIQMMVYPTTDAGITYFFDGRSGATNHPVIYQDATNLFYYVGSANRITADALPLNTWSFVEWSRVSGTSRLFVDGIQVGSSYADTTNLANMAFRWGRSTDAGTATDPVYIDEIRVLTTGGNITNYNAPTVAFPGLFTVTSVFNSADKAATVTLLNDDRSAYTSANFGSVRGTTSHATGVHQFEVTFNGPAMDVLVGLSDAGADLTNYPGAVATSWGYYSANGNKYNNNSAAAYGASYVEGDVIGVVYDADAGNLIFYKNGASQGTAYAGLSGAKFPIWGSGNNTAGVRSGKINTGQTDFKYPIGGATAWG